MEVEDPPISRRDEKVVAGGEFEKQRNEKKKKEKIVAYSLFDRFCFRAIFTTDFSRELGKAKRKAGDRDRN